MAKERMFGTPRTDVERVMAHYNISREEAQEWLSVHPASELLPPRGTGLKTGRDAGVSEVSESPGSGLGVLALIGLAYLVFRKK